MANFFGFDYKTKKEREEEFQNYFKKIFPYGETQKEMVENILGQLIKEKHKKQLLMHYIMIKEAMIDAANKDYEVISANIERKKIIKLTAELKECIKLLIYKDLAVDETLKYSSVMELKEEAGGKL